MDVIEKLANLRLLHNIFINEYNGIQRNVEAFFNGAQGIYNSTAVSLEVSYDDEQVVWSQYYIAISELNYMINLFREMNFKFEISPLKKVLQQQEPSNAICYPEVTNQDVQTPKRPLLPNKFSKFSVGFQGDCVITHIEDGRRGLFYINEAENETDTQIIKEMVNYFSENADPYPGIPEEGVLFAVYLRQYIFRAFRKTNNICSNSTNQDDYEIYLLDVGETISRKDTKQLLVLPPEYHNFPPRAILCKVETVNSIYNFNVSQYLSQSLYVRHNFTVLKKSEHLGQLHVDLRGDVNPFRNHVNHESIDEAGNLRIELKPLSNPFKIYSCNIALANHRDDDSFFSDLTEFETAASIFNEEVDCCGSSEPHSKEDHVDIEYEFADKENNWFLEQNSEKSFVKVSEEEREILYEEPLNTSNALQAVMGFVPKDDERICKFYNSNIGGCFKGSACRFLHVPIIKDGWTRDEDTVIIDLPNQMAIPAIGSIVSIVPTHVVNSIEFYAQLNMTLSDYRSGLKQLIFKMNATETISQYKQFRSLPTRQELVIALYPDDGMWYRAQVINIINDVRVKVFYIDYGNSGVLNLKDIRKWEAQFQYVPMQAVKCRLWGIAEKRSSTIEATEELRKMILNKILTGQIVNNTDSLGIRLYDSNEFNVSDLLLAMDLVIKAEHHIIPTNQMQPG